MLKNYSYKIIILSIIILNGCASPPDYPIEPVITYKSMTKNHLKQSAFNIDSLSITFSFTDGDGDIGTNDSTLSLFVIDTRDGNEFSKYKLPYVSEQGTSNGISGEVQFVIYTTCCYYPNGAPPCKPSTIHPTDTVIYNIYMKDRAGHKSNIIKTDPIILDCTK